MTIGLQLSNNNPGGTSLGQASTDLISFYGATPVVRRSGATQAALTLTTSTSSGFSFTTSAAFSAMVAQVEEIRAALVQYGLLAGA
jgi:hypothetical protein